MKKNRVVIVLLILLGTISFWLIVKNKKSTLTGDEADFAVTDTASVDKLFIANKLGGSATLVKKDGQWLINNKYPARMEAVKLLLSTFKNIQIKFPAPQQSQEHLLKSIASEGTKCEIYQNGKLSKTWYVGHETQDLRGTYCLLQGADNNKPFNTVYALEIPGFIGMLPPRFFTKEEEWRETKIMSLSPDKIKNVTLDLVNYPDSGFSLDVKGLHSFEIKTVSGKKIVFDTMAVRQYLSYFLNLQVDYWCTNSFLPEIDSVRKTKNFVSISVTDINDNKETFKFYHKPPDPEKNKDEKGNLYPFDPESMYMKFKGDSEFARVAVYSWGKLFQSSNYFMYHPVKK